MNISKELPLTVKEYHRVVFLFFRKDCTAHEISLVLTLPLDTVTQAVTQEMTNIRAMERFNTTNQQLI